MLLPFPWEPGEHLNVTGRTGTGKSTLVAALLSLRRFFVILKSKTDNVEYPVQVQAQAAAAMDNVKTRRLVLQPHFERQREEFARALARVWSQGGWTVYLDEIYYLDYELRLRMLINRLLTQGRSKGITVVTGQQRPVNVTRFAMGESTHVLAFGTEGRDAKTIGEATTPRMQRAVEGLGLHQFAWFYAPTRRIWVGRLQDLGVEVGGVRSGGQALAHGH